MADVLLTHSYHLHYDAKQLRKMRPYAPLGTLYAATALREEQISVAVFDTMLASPEGFPQALAEHDPRVVVVYEDDFNFLSKMCLTRMREVAWEIAAAARRAGAFAVAHGSDATDNPELFLQNGFNYILCGESEQTLVALCSSLLSGVHVGELDGLVHKDSAGAPRYAAQKLAKNAEWAALAAPSRELIAMEPYRDAWVKAHGYFSANMVASRGCPYRCNWCAKPISGNKFHLRPALAVAQEMEQLKRDAGAQHIWFGDDVFALNQAWMQQFAGEVLARGAALPFKIQSRADLMTEVTVAALKQAGCAEVWMGVESGSQEVLKSMDKGLSLEAVHVARERLRSAGIRACYFLQFGYPGERWSDLQKTIELVRSTRPDDIGVSFSYPLPGTVFYERVQAQLGLKRNWEDSDDLCIMFEATYNSDFYRAVREALHAEVTSWQAGKNIAPETIETMWEAVAALEPASRNMKPMPLPRGEAAEHDRLPFVSVSQLLSAKGA